MNRRSIRWRITALATVMTIGILSIVGVGASEVVKSKLQEGLDLTLENRAEAVESAARTGAIEEFGPRDGDRFAFVVDSEGRMVGPPVQPGSDPPLSVVGDWRRVATGPADLRLGDDVFRVLVRPLDNGTRPGRLVVVGDNVGDLRDTVRIVTLVLLGAFAAASCALGFLVWWLVGRTLGPVESIRAEVARIGLDQLDQRVPVPGTGDEIDRLASTMNEMLGRLDTSAAHQRQFVADVSHELRTPLTRLRTLLEVELAAGGTGVVTTLREARLDVVELQALVDDLLFLARVDARRTEPRHWPVDLDTVVEDELAQLEPVRGVSLDTRVAPLMVSGDAGQLARMVRNLLSNAMGHARSTVVIRVDTGERGGVVSNGDAARERDDLVVVLVVEDDGPGVAPEDSHRVFERFVRLDPARNRNAGGTGLGLAIARDVVRLHRGSIELDRSALGGARFTVRLPAHPEATIGAVVP
jgi:signal transduction histidine kinase